MEYVALIFSFLNYFIEGISEDMIRKHMIDFLRFYSGFPEEGYYVEVLRSVRRLGRSLLSTMNGGYVIFDLDDTLLFRRLYDPFPGPEYPPIPQMVALFRLSKLMGYTTIIVTSRQISMLEETIDNCSKYGIDPHALFMQPEDNNIFFKRELRTKIQNISPQILRSCRTTEEVFSLPDSGRHYPIALSIGDQWTDVSGSETAIKLPELHDMNSYLIMEGRKYIII